MTQADLYEMWAPPGAPWSAWAKPVLFVDGWNAQIAAAVQGLFPGQPPPAPSTPAPSGIAPASPPDVSWAEGFDTAVIADLDGVASVELGVALSERGYQPVPVFNGCDGPSPVVEVASVKRALEAAATRLAGAARPDARPAFLLDARRRGENARVAPGMFDNRWLVFAQDFPSANLLLSRGIRRAVVCSSTGRIADDLAQVLLRWQEAGIGILVKDAAPGAPVSTVIPRPRFFRSLLRRFFAAMRYRRNAAGGFGSAVPEPSSGGSGGYRGGFS